MELLEFKNKVQDLFDIDSIDELPKSLLSTKYTSDIFEKYLKIVDNDLSVDWLQHLFQYYQADRKEKMQDYTPKNLSKLVAKLVNTDNAKVCLDLCAGSGSLTIETWENNKKLSFICKEFDERVIPILIFNLAIRNIKSEVVHTDVLSGEVFNTYSIIKGEKFGIVKQIEKQTLKADICISNPPYNMKWQQPIFCELQSRFALYDIPPESNANYAFILTAIDLVKNKATFILPNTVLSTANKAESAIRTRLIENNYVESIILCPDNMFSNTTIGTCIITFDKHKSTTNIEMVDCRKKYIEVEREQRGQYGGASHTNRIYKKIYKEFTDEIISDCLSCISENKNEAGYCKSATIEDVKENGYLIVPSRYIEFAKCEAKCRELVHIVEDINRIVAEKNACKLTINETLAKTIGIDVEMFKLEKDEQYYNDFIEKLSGKKLIKNNYFSTTKNKNEIKFENANKEIISSVFMMIFQMWKQHIFYLNVEENRYLAELRDAILPDLMSGKIKV